jgi:hypothetical protein
MHYFDIRKGIVHKMVLLGMLDRSIIVWPSYNKKRGFFLFIPLLPSLGTGRAPYEIKRRFLQQIAK